MELSASVSDGTVKIWDSLAKTTELDSAGAIAWDLSGGFGSIPTSVWVETTAAGDFTIELAVTAPSSETADSTSDIVVKGLDASLTAKAVDDSSARRFTPIFRPTFNTARER